MALTRSALDYFYENRKPYIEEVVSQFREHPTLFRQFLNSKSAKSGWIDTNSVSGFGTFNTKAEMVDADSDDIIQGPSMRSAVVTYAKRHLVSQEAIEDDQGDGIIASRLPEILFAGRATQEILGHDILNSGFTTAVPTPDGVALFSDSHSNLSGTAGDNLLGAVDLTEDNLGTAVNMLQTMTNDRNIPIFQNARTLIVHPTLQWTAEKILKSAQEPGTDYNAINPMASQGIKLVVTPYLTTEYNWFLLADMHKLDWYDRIQMQNWSEVDYRKSAVEVGARFRSVAVTHDWRGAVASNDSS